jgi:hypothetical protein
MRSNRLFIIAFSLIVIGVVSIFSHWHGDVGFNFGWPLTQNVVRMSGDSTGWSALIGMITLVPGLILFIVALLVAIVRR